jgi:hypothetical protein
MKVLTALHMSQQPVMVGDPALQNGKEEDK